MPSAEQLAVSHLREDIVGELRHETVRVQILTAFAVLIDVIVEGSANDPDATRTTLLELQSIMKVMQ